MSVCFWFIDEFICATFWILNISEIHGICLCLTYFTKYDHLLVHPCFCKWHYFTHFLWLQTIPVCLLKAICYFLWSCGFPGLSFLTQQLDLKTTHTKAARPLKVSAKESHCVSPTIFRWSKPQGQPRHKGKGSRLPPRWERWPSCCCHTGRPSATAPHPLTKETHFLPAPPCSHPLAYASLHFLAGKAEILGSAWPKGAGLECSLLKFPSKGESLWLPLPHKCFQSKMFWGEFPGGPVAKTQHFHCQGPGSTPGQELKSHKLHDAAKKNFLDGHLSPLHHQVVNFKLYLAIFYFCNEVRTKRLGWICS